MKNIAHVPSGSSKISQTIIYEEMMEEFEELKVPLQNSAEIHRRLHPTFDLFSGLAPNKAIQADI